MTMLGRDGTVPASGTGTELMRRTNPLSGLRSAGSRTAYTRDGVEGTVPEKGGDIVVRLAPPGRRFAALVLDLLLATVSMAVPVLVTLVLSALVNPDSSGFLLLGTWLLGYVWLTFYGAACLVLWGGTPGLLIMGLRVARLWDGTERPTRQQAYRRARRMALLAWLVPVLNVTVVLYRIMVVLRDRPYHHGYFDASAGTVVIRRPRS